jgi:hypothetical protein
VKGTLFVVAALASAVPAHAQSVAPGLPRVASPPASSQNGSRQQQVRMMEGLIVAAVRNGAEGLARQLQVAEPGSLIVTGTARARGFALEGYGVFFDVDVPQMKQSVAWSTMMLLRDARRQQLQQLLASNADPDVKRHARAELQRIDNSSGGMLAALPPSAGGASPVSQSGSGTVVAQTVPDSAPATATVDTRDPNELYTDSIKSALIDAMLNYSGPMELGADEWLTIAARDSDGPVMPGMVDDASTIVLRVKGSDIAAFVAKRISLEEARKRVQVKEF